MDNPKTLKLNQNFSFSSRKTSKFSQNFYFHSEKHQSLPKNQKFNPKTSKFSPKIKFSSRKTSKLDPNFPFSPQKTSISGTVKFLSKKNTKNASHITPTKSLLPTHSLRFLSILHQCRNWFSASAKFILPDLYPRVVSNSITVNNHSFL
jgi:hypothetical protein